MKNLLSFCICICISLVACSEPMESETYTNEYEVYIDTTKSTSPKDSTKSASLQDSTIIIVPKDSIELNDTTKNENNNKDNSPITNSDTAQINDGFICKYKAKIIGKGVFNGKDAQGCAIYENYLFNLHYYGICRVYDLSDINNIKNISTFNLLSYSVSPLNHANCAQFANKIEPDTGFPLLYVTVGHSKVPCAAEKVTLTESKGKQDIVIKDSFTGNSMVRDWIIGDDGYLWGLGHKGTVGKESYQTDFYKCSTPIFENGDTLIYSNDHIDYFEGNDNWQDLPTTWQGGKVKNGKIFFLFGTSSINRQIRIYDTKTHKRIGVIDLNKITSAEPEDIDIWQDNKIILTLNGVNYAILIEFETNPYIP